LVSERTRQRPRRVLLEFGYLMTKFDTKEARSAEDDAEDDIRKHGIALSTEPTEHGNFLIGSSREFVGFDKRCDIQILKLLAKRALRFFPTIKHVNIIRSYAGFRSWTPDHFPIISPVVFRPGLYIAAGHEGDGIGLAPITGKLITEMILGNPTTIPTHSLCLSRFKERNN